MAGRFDRRPLPPRRMRRGAHQKPGEGFRFSGVRARERSQDAFARVFVEGRKRRAEDDRVVRERFRKQSLPRRHLARGGHGLAARPRVDHLPRARAVDRVHAQAPHGAHVTKHVRGGERQEHEPLGRGRFRGDARDQDPGGGTKHARRRLLRRFFRGDVRGVVRASEVPRQRGAGRAGGDAAHRAGQAPRARRRDERASPVARAERRRQQLQRHADVVRAVREQTPLLGVRVEARAPRGGEEHGAQRADDVAEHELRRRRRRRHRGDGVGADADALQERARRERAAHVRAEALRGVPGLEREVIGRHRAGEPRGKKRAFHETRDGFRAEPRDEASARALRTQILYAVNRGPRALASAVGSELDGDDVVLGIVGVGVRRRVPRARAATRGGRVRRGGRGHAASQSVDEPHATSMDVRARERREPVRALVRERSRHLRRKLSASEET